MFVSPYTPWHWVLWLGRFSLPVVLLSCGLLPPDYSLEDEKFLRENGHATYAVGLVDHRYDLLWWLDYTWATDQAAIQNSLQKFLDTIWQATEFSHYFKGVTTDGWQAAKNAFLALNPNTKLGGCILHPLLKFKKVPANWARRTSAGVERVKELSLAFAGVLFAPDQATWDLRLAALKRLPDFADPQLADRLSSLESKQAELTEHFLDGNLARTSSALDRKFQRLERKLSSMQKFRTEEGGELTLSAWAIVHDFRQFGPGAKRAGQSPAELAGVDLQGQPWLPYLMLKLARVYWLKDWFSSTLTQT
jgi:hypothetical protein